ncbi:sensor histidine kinase [Negadavirga shengliensis]|uniref:histidine kinase n=1 Tax=Negadavirga shengliensis TaxID=1389218 RepID=A0ABV9T7X8_9BACT
MQQNQIENERIFRNWLIILFFITLTAFIISIRSISAQRKARMLVTFQKEELEKLNRELLKEQQKTRKMVEDLNEVNQTKDKLFSIVSHDLKSPINSLKGLLQYTVDENLSQEEFSLVSVRLRYEVEQVHFTLINLLHWAKSQMKGITTDPEEVPINELLDDTLSLYQSVADIKNIKIHNRLLPDTLCYADKEHCLVVLRNLINNALKFTYPNGNIYIYSKRTTAQTWEITIEDDGMGMDENTQKNLFKAHFEKHRYGTAGEKGTGLGLQLSRDFIEKNKGTIYVESALGKGSKFILTFPAAN